MADKKKREFRGFMNPEESKKKREFKGFMNPEESFKDAAQKEKERARLQDIRKYEKQIADDDRRKQREFEAKEKARKNRGK